MKKPNEQHFGSIIENVSDVLTILEADGTIRYVNPAARRTLGYTFKQLLGKNVAELIHPDDLPAALEAFQHRLEHPDAPTGYFMEVRLRHKNGGWRNFEGMGNNLLDDPTVNGIVLLARDVTEKKMVEQSLHESEQYNRMLFDSSSIGLALCRMDGSLVDVNPAYAAIIGRTVDETLALTYWDITPKEYAEQEAQQLQSLEVAGYYGPYEKECLHKDGRRVPVRLSGLIVERNGERFIWSSVEDITARKQAEEALRESEESFRMLYENVPVMNFTVGKNGKVLAVNHFGAEQLGYSVEELVGQPVVNIFRDEDRPAVRRQLKECFQDPERVFEWELRKVHKDGHLLWVHETARVMQEKDRPVLLIVCQNITDRKRAEQELKRNEQMLRLFVEHSPAAIAMFDRDMKYIVASRRYLIDYELGEQDVVGRSHYEIFPEMPERWKEIHRRCLAGAIEKADEDPFPRLSGKLDWIRWEIRPWYEAGGNIGGIILFSEVITERKRAEEALRTSEERFKAIASNTPDHIIMQDRQLRYTFVVNPQLGLTEQDMLGKTDYGFLSKEEADRLTQVKTQVMETGKPAHFETSLISTEGEAEYFDGTYVPKYDTEGQADGLIGYFRNVTERKRAEEEIRRRSDELAALLQTSKTIASTLDMGSVLQATTDSVTELMALQSAAIYLLEGEMLYLGATSPALPSQFPEEFRRAPLTDHPHIREAITTGLPNFLPDSASADLTPAERAVSEARGLRSILYLPLLAGAKVVGALIVASVGEPRVISEAEIDVCRTLANLAALAVENAQLFESVQHHAAQLERRGDELAALNALGRQVNQTLSLDEVVAEAVQEMLKMVQADVAFLFLREGEKLTLAGIGPQGAAKKFGEMPEHRVGECMCGLAVREGKPLYSRNIFADMRCTWEECKKAGFRSFAALPLRSGTEIIGVVGLACQAERNFEPQAGFLETLASQVASGIRNAQLYAEVQRYAEGLEQRVAERTAELQAANQGLETFAYTVSHDLKAPLRGLDGYSRLLLEDHASQLDEEGRQFLFNVRHAAGQMNNLIDDLLTYSRLERRLVTSGTVNLGALIEAILAERADEIQSRRVKVTVKIPFGNITADPEGLTQALRNLVDNALKFTVNVPRPVIKIVGRESKKGCILELHDNGVGFDMQYQERIFEIFQRLHRAEEYPGTGVGLAIVRKAMERMGGRAWAESTPGKGATFYLEIPK